jgi:hypothetical protein
VPLTLARVAAFAALGSAVVYAAYAIGTNLLLSSGGLARLLSGRPTKLRVEYARARTLWPGHVHVEGLDVRGRSARLEWELHLDAADADIALFALARRRFHVQRVTATGVTFRARFRLEAKDVTDDRIARIPPIAGLDAVPLQNPEEEASEGSGDAGKREGFVVQLENVDASGVREVWIDSFRLTGVMTAAGAFQLGPDHRLEVAPSSMQVEGGRLAVGDDAIFSNLSGAADAVLEPLNTEEVKGTKVLRSLTTHSGFTADVGGLEFLRHFLEGKPFELAGGAGAFSGLLTVERGIVKRGSRSHVELGPARLTTSGWSIGAISVVDLAAGEDDAGGWGTGDITLASVALTETGAARPAITSPAMSLSGRLNAVDLAEPPRDFSYTAAAPRAELEEMSWVEAKLPRDGPFHIDGGKATLGIEARGSMKELTTEVAVASTISVRIDGAPATTTLDASVHARCRFDARTIELSDTVAELKGLAVNGARARGDWWGALKLDSAEIQLSPPTFTASITTRARDARPLLSLYSAMRHTSPAVTTALALVPDPLIESMTSNLHGSLRIVVGAGSLALHGLDVRGAQTRVRGELVKHGEAKRGGLLFVAGPASAGVAFDGEKSDVVLVGAPGWFEGSVAQARSW